MSTGYSHIAYEWPQINNGRVQQLANVIESGRESRVETESGVSSEAMSFIHKWAIHMVIPHIHMASVQSSPCLARAIRICAPLKYDHFIIAQYGTKLSARCVNVRFFCDCLRRPVHCENENVRLLRLLVICINQMECFFFVLIYCNERCLTIRFWIFLKT